MSNTKGEYGTRCFWCWCSFDFQDIYGNYPTANEKKSVKLDTIITLSLDTLSTYHTCSKT